MEANTHYLVCSHVDLPMSDFESEVRLIKITGVKKYRSQPILTATARPTDEFDEIIIFKRNEFDVLFGPNGVESKDQVIFALLTDLFDDGVARAKAHKFRVFGSIPANVDNYTKICDAQFEQGSARAEVNGGKCALESTALVTGTGSVKLEFDRAGDTYRATIQDYTTPPPAEGQIVEGKIPEQGDNDKAVVSTPDGRYSVQLDKSAPYPGDVEVKILTASHPIQGKLVSYVGTLPTVGDIINTTMIQQIKTPTVSIDGVTFQVLLSEPPVTTGEVTIEITDTDQTIRGEVVNHADLPAVGDVVTIAATRGETPSRVSPEGEQYEIELDKQLIMDSKVNIEITATGDCMKGTLRSYCGSLPKVGREVRAKVTHRGDKIIAEPDLRTFVIHILEDTEYRGPAKVEITGASLDMITGRIIEEVEVEPQSRSKVKFNNPFR